MVANIGVVAGLYSEHEKSFCIHCQRYDMERYGGIIDWEINNHLEWVIEPIAAGTHWMIIERTTA
ncbi:hypothetical protein GCM10028773_51690 [Spirosoma koreense]